MAVDFTITIKTGASNSLNVPARTGEYTLINAALDAYITSQGSDLTAAAGTRLILDCEAFVSTENVELGPSFSNRYFITDSASYVWIRSKSTNRYNGIEGSCFVLAPVSGVCLNYYSNSTGSINYLRIDGVEFSGDNGANDGIVIHALNTNYLFPVIVQFCIFHDLRFGIIVGGAGLYPNDPYRGNYAYIGCCLGYNINRDFIRNDNYKNTYVMNCTGFACVTPVFGDRVVTSGGISGVNSFRMLNTYGKIMDNPVSAAFLGAYINTHTNFNANSSSSAILYMPGSVGGSNLCVTNVLSYKNSDDANQDGTLANFILGITDTSIKGAAYNLDSLGGAYEDCVENGNGIKVDILGKAWPPAGDPIPWDIGAFTTYISTFEVVSSAGAHGTINPLGTILVDAGTDAVFQIFPDSGYKVKAIYLDGVPQTITETFTIPNIDADHTLYITFIRLSGFTLRYPIIGAVTDEAVLRSPVKGNNLARTMNANLDRLKLNDLRVIRDKSWPIVKRYTYAFEALNQTVVDALKAFITTTTGLEILWIDHENVTRYGYIVIDSVEYVRVRRDLCSFDVSLVIQETVAKAPVKYITEGGGSYLVVEDGIQVFVPEEVDT